MYAMLVTVDTSHFDRSWLKLEALSNMPAMLVTADTSHFDRSWLKAEVKWNIFAILVTADTSHCDRSWLKLEALLNNPLISATPETFHAWIDPYETSEQSPTSDSLIHSEKAAMSSSFDCGLNAAAVGV